MDDEELDYVSSSALLTTPPETKVEDEVDLPALKQIQKRLAEQIASYASISRLALGDKTFTIEQQLAINKAIVEHLTEMKVLVDTVIDNIREKYNG